MTQKNKKTNVNLLEGGVACEFNHKYLEDGTLQLYKYKPLPKDFERVKLTLQHTYYGGDMDYVIKVRADQKEYEAVINVMHTSENNYTVCGFTKDKCLLKNCKNMADVSGFIKANFCRQLTDAL